MIYFRNVPVCIDRRPENICNAVFGRRPFVVANQVPGFFLRLPNFGHCFLGLLHQLVANLVDRFPLLLFKILIFLRRHGPVFHHGENSHARLIDLNREPSISGILFQRTHDFLGGQTPFFLHLPALGFELLALEYLGHLLSKQGQDVGHPGTQRLPLTRR